jgi:S1-C subfamily serine protease
MRTVAQFFAYIILCSLLSAAQNPASTLPERSVESVARDGLKSVVIVLVSDQNGKLMKFGSGFVASSDGKVVTNYHVVEDGFSARVRFHDGSYFDIAGVLASDPTKDLAILKIKSSNREFIYLPIADSSTLEVGQQVVSIGTPEGFESTVSTGIVSAIREAEDLPLGAVRGTRVIQTTAPISHGSSGGVLLNLKGQVVGVPTFLFAQGQNLNFAIPSSNVSALLLRAHEEVTPKLPTSTAVTTTPRPMPHRSTEEAIQSAKTLCVWVGSGSPVLKTELSGKLSEWGKLTLVSSPEDADLILEVVQVGQLNLGTGDGNQATALLRDRISGTELWSKTKGGSWAMSGWSNAWVARALAKEFIKFYESKVPRKTKAK